MFEENPQVSETLEWMLQSRQVGDRTLVKTLVHEHYSSLVQLGTALFSIENYKRGEYFAEQVICRAVTESQEYRQEISVPVWLTSKAVEIYLSSSREDRNNSGQPEHPGRVGNTQPSPDMIQVFTSNLPKDSRIIFILRYLQAYSTDEIATILSSSPSRVEGKLDFVLQQWFSEFGQSAQEENFGYEIANKLNDCWQAISLNEREELQVVGRILGILKEKDRRKNRLVIFAELVLVLLAVFAVAGMSNLIDELTPEPTTERIYQTQLVNQVIVITSTPEPTQPPTPFPEMAILYLAEGGESLDDIADRYFLNVTILQALNNIPIHQPLKRGERIMIGVRESQVLMPTNERYTAVPQTPSPTLIPLDTQSADPVIRERIHSSRQAWKSLWADSLIIQYGPPGYVGEPQLRREQIWIEQPYFSYLLDGLNSGEIEYLYISLGGLVNLINSRTGEQLTTTGFEQIQDFPRLQQMLLPSELREDFGGKLEVLQDDVVAGRETLVLDWYKYPDTDQAEGMDADQVMLQGRYWIDASLGLILRRQIFNGNDPTQILEEIIVTGLEINPEIPRSLYDRSQPIQIYYAKNSQNEPDRNPIPIPEYVMEVQREKADRPRRSPPVDYPLDESFLTIQWTDLENFNVEKEAHVDIYADGYYLGNVEFVEPNQLLCARSPDGRLLAATGWSANVPMGYAPIRWLDLYDLPNVVTSLPEIVPYDFSFSPDNQQLAVYGCQREGDQDCGIYLIDTASGATRFMTGVEMGSGLLWSPDSSQIAIQGSFLRHGKWRILVFDVTTGQTVYDGTFDWEGFWVAQDSPVHDWGVAYPPIRGGLEICAQPPGGG